MGNGEWKMTMGELRNGYVKMGIKSGNGKWNM